MESPAPHQIPHQAWGCSQHGRSNKLSWGLELFPGGQKGAGQTCCGGCLGVLGGCSPLQSRAWTAPHELFHGKGTGSQDFSTCSLTTLGHLGQVVSLFPTEKGGEM